MSHNTAGPAVWILTDWSKGAQLNTGTAKEESVEGMVKNCLFYGS